jgi:hypothetical protein
MELQLKSVTETVPKHLWPEVCYTDGIFDTVQGRNCAMKSQINGED